MNLNFLLFFVFIFLMKFIAVTLVNNQLVFLCVCVCLFSMMQGGEKRKEKKECGERVGSGMP